MAITATLEKKVEYLTSQDNTFSFSEKLEERLISTKTINRVPVLNVTDYDVSYETVSRWRRILHLLWVKLITWFSLIGKTLFIRGSKMGRRIKRFKTTHVALEMIYTYDWSKTSNRNIIDRVLTHVLLYFLNAKAVRNRLCLVKKELKEAIVSLRKEEVTIASLGAGSARAIIETVSELIEEYDYSFKIILVDIRRSALRYSKKLAREYGVAENVEWIRVKGLLEEFVQNTHDHPPDIVEMVGIMDYFNKIDALDIYSHLYDILTPFGILLASNIRKNSEKIFLDRVLEWPMIYRDSKNLAELVLSAGFEPDNVRIICEPLKIHGLIVARKVPWRFLRKNKTH